MARGCAAIRRGYAELHGKSATRAIPTRATGSGHNQGPSPSRRLGARYRLFAICLCLCCSSEPEKGPYDTDPLEPAAALGAFEIVDRFEIELFAAEPHVVDPVEICFDENGGIYVAEMLDYPFDPSEGEEPRSRIRFLEDTDDDGVIDKSTVFADKLLQVTSVFPWKGGVFATSAPDILYLKDTDGDHVADQREVWYTGFETDVSPEARITNLRFGIDNWIYAANNGRTGKITSPKFPDLDGVYISGFDFRFQPVTGEFAPAAGPTQFGMSFDEWGNRFVTQNTVHLRHAVLPARYLLRNPNFRPESMLHYVPGDDPRNSKVYPLTQPQQWRIERTAARQERYDETVPGRQELVGGHFTAATGTTVYLGAALGGDVAGNVFVADANGGLVHREVLSDDGVTFRARPVPVGKEFLASTDPWFRPVNMANAPDGNLYVLDFYREYIEEPASIPESIKERLQLDFYRGDDRGRIWRVRRSGATDGAEADFSGDLVKLLESPNGWIRRTAQRLLLEREDPASAASLTNVAADSESPRARLHALWALRGMNQLTAEHVRAALADPHPGVRANAVRLAEGFLSELSSALVPLQGDPNAKVRFQLALSIGEIPSNSRLLASMAEANAHDPWFRAALLSSAGDSAFGVVNRLIVRHGGFFSSSENREGNLAFLKDLAGQVGAAGTRSDLALLFQALSGSPRLRAPEWTAATLSGLAAGLAARGERQLRLPATTGLFARWLGSSSEQVRDSALETSQYFALSGMQSDARRAAAAEELDLPRRVRAVRFLRGGAPARTISVLARILAAPAPPELHQAAIEAASVFNTPETADAVLAAWSSYSPENRTRATNLLLRQTAWSGKLLDALDAGTVAESSIDTVAQIRLRQHPDPGISERANGLFSQNQSDRAAVVEQFQEALTLEADLSNGRQVFEEACAKCHTPQGGRGRIGPDLSGINNKTREELLSHILDPSFEIQAAYTNYVAIDKQGRIFDGLLRGETADSVTLRGEYENMTLKRSELKELRASAVSLMPEGLEDGLTARDVADLIGYLRAGL